MPSETLQCAATLENLAQVTGFVEECAERFELDIKKRFNLVLVLEEVFVNVCSYAYPDGVGDVEICCGTDGDAFVLQVADGGSPFDVLSLPEPDTTSDIMDRDIGGLGIHFMRKLSDGASYRREDGRNILRILFRSPLPLSDS